ncbi:MAG: ATP synthase F1 subunit delta [Chloroflexi bacterium]|nr:ATP synthase F1 subunit delta [Chloroflexota bacterium]
MASGAAAKRYAQAIFGIAHDANNHDAWLSDLAAIAEISQHPRASEYLGNPKIAQSDKETVAARLLTTIQPQAMNLVKMLIARRRLDLAPAIFDAFEGLVNEARGISEASVITAVELTEDEAERLRKQLETVTGKQIILTRRVDPDILGGMVARIGAQLIDGSTRPRLDQLRRTLAGAAR